MSEKLAALGIDLGTTNCCIGIWKNGKVDIIPNQMGNRVTPSYVSFSKDQIVVGEGAKNLAMKNQKNTIYDCKRLIGRNFDDSTVQNDIKNWGFQVKKDPIKNTPKIHFNYQNEEQSYYPEQISSLILKQLKNDAEIYTGKTIKDAIITVPAYFNDRQRQATKDAGKIAGLNVLRIINEPTAAALAYGLDKKMEDESKVLVFDLGGGTFDVSILILDDGIFDVKGTKGDTHLGGEDFDLKLVDYCIEEFKKKNNIDIRSNNKSLARLKDFCERAKISLSTSLTHKIEIDALINGKDLNIDITRAKFESLCYKDFEKCIKIIDDVLKETKTDKSEINEVVLVGGSTKIPKICQMVSAYFSGKELNKNINPDEAVAYGAAIEGAILNHVRDDILRDVILLDVCPLSLGIEQIGKKLSVIIPKNSQIPIKKTLNYCTTKDNQTFARFSVYEGEYEDIQKDNLLGKFTIKGLPKKKKGEINFDVTFQIDANSILEVTAVETSQGLENNITIINDRGNLTQLEIDKFKEETDTGSYCLLKDENDILSFRNIKNKMKSLEESFNKQTDMNMKFYYSNLLIDVLEEYINGIEIGDSNNLDMNRTLYDKFKMYLKKLFFYYNYVVIEGKKQKKANDYIKIKNDILAKVKNFINTIKNIDFDSVPSLIKIFKDYKSVAFYELLIYEMRLYFNRGLNLYNNKDYKNSKYIFSESISICSIYKIKNDEIFKQLESEIQKELNDILESCSFYIKRINVNLLMKEGEDYLNKGVYEKETIEMSYVYLSLDKYRTAFKEISESSSETDIEYESICLSYITKILYKIIKADDDNVYPLGVNCIHLADSLPNKNIKNEKWYIETAEIVNKIKEKKEIGQQTDEEIKRNIKNENPQLFKAIEQSFNKGNLDFIEYILKNHPYNGYKPIDNLKDTYKKDTKKFLRKLRAKYHPDNLEKISKEQKKIFAIFSEIESLLNSIISFDLDVRTPGE